ncbi:exopolyphosphatase/guanosine-5'-triphosphate,3'-diphosphate pyrophosphatase [Hoeflea marina]|uniref:Exopolyphosphatase/guanosine-5'-triphosphate, 3'-diphosphate pyrophosphatase n=1 Tax=Hoeflea marina TaxID=274592 RepID=A0A317PM13_9HYPH|nr:Ppx/GppA phosphatase family protein [Hoeflea marina]PWW01553.1 exopolyphosphatase/guanosine-5'-triphosphate,3'-diphosphate pyrophosphatase [Hoeflea marina]
MTNSPDGERPDKGETLAGERPSAGAREAASGGTETGRGHAASSGSTTGGTPSDGTAASASPDVKTQAEPRGRRRRRRRKSPQASARPPAPDGASGQTADARSQSARPDRGSADAVPSGETGRAADSQAKGKKGRKRRRKPARALQGRPLVAPSGRPPQGHPAASAAGPSSGPQSPSPRLEQPATGPRPQPRPPLDDLYAALDLGTNNCRLLIAQPTRPGQFRVVDAFSRIVRLGEGLAATGRLSEEAMDRAVEALRVCAAKLGNRTLRLERLIATEACRSAANGAEFLARVLSETGLDLEIVDRQTEARLAVAGCSSLVGRETDGLVLFDIGGGSSEIAMIDLTHDRSNRLANHIKAWTSLPVGVVTLSERHGGSLVTPEVFAAMVAEVDGMLDAFLPPPLPAFENPEGRHRVHLLGTSGTVTTLAGLHLELPRYDRRKVDGLWLENAEVDRMLDLLLSWDFEARAANPCIGADRADLVLAGCAILQSIRKRWPSERMRVADRGLREGLLNEMMAADGAWRRSGRRHRARLQGSGPAAPLSGGGNAGEGRS